MSPSILWVLGIILVPFTSDDFTRHGRGGGKGGGEGRFRDEWGMLRRNINDQINLSLESLGALQYPQLALTEHQVEAAAKMANLDL